MSEYDRGIQERFEEFLRDYPGEQGNFPYWTKIQNMYTDKATSLIVNFQDLASFDSEFTREAKEDPKVFLEQGRNALISLLTREAPEYLETVDKSLFHIRIIRGSGEPVDYPEHVPLRAIRSKHIGQMIHISGIMIRASEVKPLLDVARFRCRVCKTTEWDEPQEEGRYTEPLACPTCGVKTPVKLLPEDSRFVDWQKVRIQESPDELPPGQMPRSLDVILQGDIVDISRPGDLLGITGILKTTPDFSRKGSRLATFNIFVEANGVEIKEKEYEALELTPEDMKRIEELAKDPYIHERICASIAPAIQGYESIKESIALLLFGGVDKPLPDGTRLRGRSNILLIGDPGTGKSQILKFVAGLAARGLYTSGKGTSAAGLTAAVMHDTDTGAMTLEAGALVLADKGIACIDEFDKMDPNDRTAIHEAMEQHTVSIAKAGIIATLNARTSILAAANPKYGRYVQEESFQKNTDLPFTILSRFDLIWIMVDVVEQTKDRELARFILTMHQKREAPTQKKLPPIEPGFLKKYIRYSSGRIIPQLTSEAAEVIENFYVAQRKPAEGGAAPVPITARQLEALVRLAEARARIALKTRVDKDDAQSAVRLMNESLLMVTLDKATGLRDIDIVASEMSRSQRNSLEIIMKAMNDLEMDGQSEVSEETLLQRVKTMKLSEAQAREAIAKLTEGGDLFNPRPGKIKLSKRVQS